MLWLLGKNGATLKYLRSRLNIWGVHEGAHNLGTTKAAMGVELLIND